LGERPVMRISVQTSSFDSLKEAALSDCDDVRFGSEFCELNLPSEDQLKEGLDLALDNGKEFTYVTPRLSNSGIERVRRHLALLDSRGDVRVVFNDLGTLNIMEGYRNLRPHIGRQLCHVPARCPWSDKIIERGAEGRLEKLYHRMTRRWVERAFSTTSLNYRLTLDLYERSGARGLDVDWIPRIFPSLGYLRGAGLSLSLHTELILATWSRRCYTAHFLGEEDLSKCSRPCLDKGYVLKGGVHDVELFLHGNVVYSFRQPSLEDAKRLRRGVISELVLSMNPLTGFDDRKKIDDFKSNSEAVKALR